MTVINARTAYKACMSGLGANHGCDASSLSDEIYPDDYVRDRAIELLNRKPKGKPWFMQVNFPGPHDPIVSTSRMAASVMDRQWPDAINNKNYGKCPQQELYNGNNNPDTMPPQMSGRCNSPPSLRIWTC